MDSWTILFLFSMINLAILFSIIRYIPHPTIVNKFSTKYSYERNRNAVLSSTLPLAAIFPRVSTFYFDVRFIPAPPEETGTPFFRLFRNNPSFSFLEHRKPRSSIFRGNLGFHSAACRYLHQSSFFRLSSPANWQFRLSGISGAHRFTRRRNSGCHLPSAPLFKVGNTLATFLPPHSCSDAGRSRIAVLFPRRAVLQSGHVAAA